MGRLHQTPLFIICTAGVIIWIWRPQTNVKDYIKEIEDLKRQIHDLQVRADAKENSPTETLKRKDASKNKLDVESEIEWSKSLMQKGKKYFSQNDEDGVIEAVFNYVGTTDKVYVEFGVENGDECNTRYLREKKDWDVKASLLMDGGHENPEINLKKVIFWPDNILSLFEKFGVQKEFDFLSLDVDSYDWFMLEAILNGGYSPRVIICEYNSNFEIHEAKSIMPPEDGKSWQRWDNTTYQGMSLRATTLLLNRFSYSVVWCNSINCIAVMDAELSQPMRRPVEEFRTARLDAHKCDKVLRELAVIEESGKWTGRTDKKKGSPNIRCPWHKNQIMQEENDFEKN